MTASQRATTARGSIGSAVSRPHRRRRRTTRVRAQRVPRRDRPSSRITVAATLVPQSACTKGHRIVGGPRRIDGRRQGLVLDADQRPRRRWPDRDRWRRPRPRARRRSARGRRRARTAGRVSRTRPGTTGGGSAPRSSGRSVRENAPITPGSRRAASTSIRTIFACAWGLRTTPRESAGPDRHVADVPPLTDEEAPVLAPQDRLPDHVAIHEARHGLGESPITGGGLARPHGSPVPPDRRRCGRRRGANAPMPSSVDVVASPSDEAAVPAPATGCSDAPAFSPGVARPHVGGLTRHDSALYGYIW